MNNEKILYYLGILENGALNYYQTIETIRIASQSIQDYIEQLEQQCKKQKEVIDKAVEYITSYESISTIQGLTHAEDNKQFDEKTMVEMTNRYLLVHDKLLQILEDKEVSE